MLSDAELNKLTTRLYATGARVKFAQFAFITLGVTY